MKSSLRLVLSVAAFGAASVFASAADREPAYLDFGKITPAKEGQSVEIDLDDGLLGLAAQFAEGQEKEAAQILRGLKHVRVHVIGLDQENRAAVLDRIREVRAGLANDGWKRIAMVKDTKGEDVAIFARLNGSSAIHGLTVTVVEADNQAVIVSLTGEIKPEQIAALGQRFNIDPLKKLAVAK